MYDYPQLKITLQNMADEKYRDFHQKLVPDVKNQMLFLGIPIPKLRKLAREILAECDNIDDYFCRADNEFYEEVMLRGIVTGLLKCDYQKKLAYITDFVPLITDWAICDIFCSSIRIAHADKENFYGFLQPYLTSEKEFSVRFGVVMLLRNYVCEDWIAVTLDTLKTVTHKAYYVQMAVAWALCECYIKFPEQTLPLFQAKIFDKFVQNKAVQKCRESRRVSDEDKIRLLQYRF